MKNIVLCTLVVLSQLLVAGEIPDFYTIKNEGRFEEMAVAAECLIYDSSITVAEKESIYLNLMEANLKLGRTNDLENQIDHFIATYPNSISLARVYYFDVVYKARNRRYYEGLISCINGLKALKPHDVAHRDRLIDNGTRIIAEHLNETQITEILNDNPHELLKPILITYRDRLQALRLQPMAGYPHGLYKNFDDFRNKRIAGEYELMLILEPDPYKKYRGIVSEKHDDFLPQYGVKCRRDGKWEEWSTISDGALWAIAQGNDVYIACETMTHLDPYGMARLNVFNNYSWYETERRLGSDAGSTVYEKINVMVVNMKNGDTFKLSVPWLEEVLQETPKLLAEFNDLDSKSRYAVAYFRKYLNETNPVN